MMAKDDGKNGKKKGSKAKLKVPKTVAGVKVPKDVRKAADPILRLAQSPLAADIAAAALTAAAAKLTARRTKGVANDTVSALAGPLKGALAALATELADKALSALENVEDRVEKKAGTQGTKKRPAGEDQGA
jgi:hypothetical protein